MSGHADTIRLTTRHDRMRVLNTLDEHPSTCPGCAADRALDALLADKEAMGAVCDRWEREYAALLAENRRYKKALRRIELWPFDVTATPEQDLGAIKESAREALAGDAE